MSVSLKTPCHRADSRGHHAIPRFLAAWLCFASFAQAAEIYFDLTPPTRASSGWGTAAGNLRLSDGPEKPKPDGPESLVFAGDAPPPAAPLTLWYRRPAQRWLEALPLGNGRLGAMVFGGVMTERLALNESTFWSGASGADHENPSGHEHLAEIRARLFEGEFRTATSLINRHLLGRPGNYGTHLPVGDLLTFSRGGIAGAAENIFCVDGNSSGAAGIAEMLLQSHTDEIELLPALPKAWPNGRVTGLKARGNLTVDIEWKEGRVVSYRIASPEPRPVRVRANGEVRMLRSDKL